MPRTDAAEMAACATGAIERGPVAVTDFAFVANEGPATPSLEAGGDPVIDCGWPSDDSLPPFTGIEVIAE